MDGVLDSDDTRVMMAALEALGIGIQFESSSSIVEVQGCLGRIPSAGADLDVANSGTTARFLAAMLSLGKGRFRLDGTPRMRERPIQDLLDTLQQLGAEAISEQENGCPPLVIRARGLAGGSATIRGDVSSQFLSGLLMAAPYAAAPVELNVEGVLASQPYVRMTLEVMRAFGGEVEEKSLRRFHVSNRHHYAGRSFAIEPDASAASYFFAAAAITGGRVTVEGLSRESLQGDIAFTEILSQMGCEVIDGPDSITVEGRPLSGLDANMNAISDTVQTLAAVALFAEGPTTIRNVAHVRHKETDRINALAIELRKLGVAVDERPDGLRIEPAKLRAAEIDTYDDHRMAMSLALVGLRLPGVIIRDPECTAKTYPRYFEDLYALATLSG